MITSLILELDSLSPMNFASWKILSTKQKVFIKEYFVILNLSEA